MNMRRYFTLLTIDLPNKCGWGFNNYFLNIPIFDMSLLFIALFFYFFRFCYIRRCFSFFVPILALIYPLFHVVWKYLFMVIAILKPIIFIKRLRLFFISPHTQRPPVSAKTRNLTSAYLPSECFFFLSAIIIFPDLCTYFSLTR